ncbi:MAG: hypothetical protein ABW121_22135, partial [Candidatus Thiodiazotropha sp. 6PLUC7]
MMVLLNSLSSFSQEGVANAGRVNLKIDFGTRERKGLCVSALNGGAWPHPTATLKAPLPLRERGWGEGAREAPSRDPYKDVRLSVANLSW